MSVIVVNTWLVRSFTHQYELLERLGKTALKIGGARVEDKLYFDVLEHPRYGTVHVSMNPFGLVSFRIESDGGDVEGLSREFMKDAEELFVEKIMKSTQQVSYNQIKEGVMPLSFHRVILDKTFKPEGLTPRKAGSLTLYYDEEKIHSNDFIICVHGTKDTRVLDALDYFSYTVLASRYVASRVSTMSDIYGKADTLVKEIDEMSEGAEYSKDQLTTLRRGIITTDFIRRECSEHYGKIRQATKNFEHVEKAFQGEGFSGDNKAVAESLDVENAFEKLSADADYLIPLWRDVLIKNLENLAFAVDARVSFQESLEIKKEQKEVRLLRHITVVGLAAALIRLGTLKDFYHGSLITYGILAIAFSAAIILIVEYFSGSLRRSKRR